jgi:hypothetical protein
MDIKTFRRLGIAAVIVAATSAITPVDASASSQRAKVPGRPKILVVESIFRSKNFVDLKITIELPVVSSRNKITGSEVLVGKRKCTIRKNGNSCTIKKVRKSMTIENITAKSKNRSGFGKSSAKVLFSSTAARWVRTGYTPAGVKFPAQARATSNTRVFSNSPNERWAKFQAFSQTSVSSRSASRVSSASGANPTITFVTEGIIGLALPDLSMMHSGSGLYAVRSDGTAIDAVRSGSTSVRIRDFFTAPNNRFYIVFQSPVEINVGQPLCVLVEVDEFSGNPRCVDPNLSSVNADQFHSWNTHFNPSVQFDDFGNIYYSGNIYANNGVCYLGSPCPNYSWPQKIRRATSSGVSDVLTDYVQNSDYVVLGDGSILITGRTSSTQVAWTRKISVNGAVSSIMPTQGASFLRKFADGNVYFGVNNGQAVKRYITATGTLDPRDWFSTSYMQNQTDPYFSTSTICGMEFASWGSFCQGGATMLKYSFNIAGTRTFAVSGYTGSGSSRLLQFFPSPERTNTSLTNITVAAQAGDKIVLAGTNAQGVNSLVVYDPLTFQETVLVDATNEIEIYSMAYVRATGKLMFNGMVFATGRYVMGEITIP